jgi:hypothetical protein
MKAMKILAIMGAICCSLLLSNAVRAQGTNTAPSAASSATAKPPVVVLPSTGKLPADIRALLADFEAARDRYEANRTALLEKLQGATAEQREAVRAQLQTDRAQYLAEITEFRKQLSAEVANLKLKIHNEELLRLISAGQGPTGVHKGH